MVSKFIIGAICAFLLSIMGALSTVQAAYIDASNKEWRSVSETNAIWLADFENACDVTTSLCSGSVTNFFGDTVDLTGWTWASYDEVIQVYSEVTGMGFTNDFSEVNSAWAPQLVSTLGGTLITNYDLLSGITSTPGYHPTYGSDVKRVIGVRDNHSTGKLDYFFADSDSIATADGLVTAQGYYLYRQATVVPLPAAVWLFGSGLLGLIGVARRKKA